MASIHSPTVPKYVLPLIIASQLAGTSVWFAGNAVLSSMQVQYQLPDRMLGHLTTAVQIGFIIGTLVFALFMLADRFSPVKLFMVSALLAAGFNVLLIHVEGNPTQLLALRFLTGFFLAGVYPVGMKIASDWYSKGLGKALGFLVAALVAGTALPHFLNYNTAFLHWPQVFMLTSLFAAAGGLLIGLLLKDGPGRSGGSRFDLKLIPSFFRDKHFNAAAQGYFGHMWELYTFWVFVPVLLQWYNRHHGTTLPVAFWSFLIIASGSISCIVGGFLSRRFGSAQVAWFALWGSGICCVLAPFVLLASPYFFLALLFCWSTLVIADSPQFSALVASAANPATKGTAITIVTCIGFAITVVSIQLLNELWWRMEHLSYQPWLLWILVLGPVYGLFAMRSMNRKSIHP